jgi:AraC-like DNA-binding protein
MHIHIVTRDAEQYSLDDVPEPDRAGAWEQLLGDTHGEFGLRFPATAGYRARVRRQWIDDLALVDCECDPCSGVRGRSRVRKTTADHIAVLVSRCGRETVQQCGEPQELRVGDALIWDSEHPARFTVWEPTSKRTLLIPRAVLDEMTGRSWAAAGVVLDGAAPATRLLTGYLDLLAATLPTLGLLAVTAARNATLELFVGAARPATLAQVGPAPGPALRAIMEAWIDRNLGSQEITPAAIAAAHGVSVRTVHRVFAAGDPAVGDPGVARSVGAVVRLRRLARARDDLAVRAEPISVIARRWGFTDSSHFSRAFRAHFGMTPSDYRHRLA